MRRWIVAMVALATGVVVALARAEVAATPPHPGFVCERCGTEIDGRSDPPDRCPVCGELA
jgi:rubrerythrin